MMNQYDTRMTKIGFITIQIMDHEIKVLEFGEKVIPDSVYGKSESLDLAFLQLEEYFDGKRKTFSLPLNPDGTEFQKKVWKELLKIPYGETRCYQDLAIGIGNEKASRAIGMANHNNPIAIMIPCHRVIGKNGSLVGYAGGIETKIELLELEKKWK